MPAPVMPPPMTATSNGSAPSVLNSFARSRRSRSGVFMDVSAASLRTLVVTHVVTLVPDAVAGFIADRHPPGQHFCAREGHAKQRARLVDRVADIGGGCVGRHVALRDPQIPVAPRGIGAEVVNEFGAAFDTDFAVRQRLFVD